MAAVLASWLGLLENRELTRKLGVVMTDVVPSDEEMLDAYDRADQEDAEYLAGASAHTPEPTAHDKQVATRIKPLKHMEAGLEGENEVKKKLNQVIAVVNDLAVERHEASTDVVNPSIYDILCDVMDWGSTNTKKGMSPEKAGAAIHKALLAEKRTYKTGRNSLGNPVGDDEAVPVEAINKLFDHGV